MPSKITCREYGQQGAYLGSFPDDVRLVPFAGMMNGHPGFSVTALAYSRCVGRI
jgi:hypothetical protein